MAKPLGPKTRLIRSAISGNPEKSNKLLAEMINDSQSGDDDKITVTPYDVAQQRQAMKKPGAETVETVVVVSEVVPVAVPASVEPAPEPAPAKPAGKKRGRKTGKMWLPKGKGPKPAPAPATTVASSGPVDLLDRVLDLAEATGGFGELKRLVDRLMEIRGR